MDNYQTDPYLFGAIVLLWPVLLGFLGGWKCFFQDTVQESTGVDAD